MLKVKQGNTELFDIEAYQYNAEIMGDVNLSCDVYLNAPLTYFSLEMYVNINGENLYLSSFEPTGIKNTDNIYPKYSLIFESKRVQLKRKYFRDLTGETEAGIDWGTEYSFYSDINDFAERFQKNLTKYFGSDWDIEIYDAEHQSNIKVLFESSNLYLFDALKQMSETWDKEWKIVSSGATNIIQVGFPDVTLDHYFEYEGGNAGGGLTVIQKEVDTSNIITRMLSAGSTKNIPYQYFRQLSASELAAGNVQDPNVAPIFSNGYYNLMPKCFREYISGYNNQSFAIETTNWTKGRHDATIGVYNPITYYEKNINLWGEREGIVEVNEEIFPTITDVTIDGIGLIDEVVDVEQILSNEQSSYPPIIRHYLDYTTTGDKFGQTIEIGSFTIGTASEEEFSYLIYSHIIAGSNNSFIIDIKYQSGQNWITEFSEIHICDATTVQTEINNTVKLLLNNTVYKVFININAHTSSFLITQSLSSFNFKYNTKSQFNNYNQIIDNYFQLSSNISYTPIVLNNNYAYLRKIKSVLNEVSYISGSFDININMCSCNFKLVLQVDDGNGNFIDAPAYIDDEGIVYESYRLYTIESTTENSESKSINFTFYLNQNYDYRLVTRIIELNPIYKYNGNHLKAYYDYKVNEYNNQHPTLSALPMLPNIFSEAYLAWGQGDYNIPFLTAKVWIDYAISHNIFTALGLTNLINGFKSYSVEFNMPFVFTQKIGRPYKGYFSIWIKDIGFNINDYLSTETAQINFTTGAIAGEDYLFDINEVTPDTTRSYNGVPSGYRLKCIKSNADKDATGLAIPNTFKQGQAGDKFILLNINMPYDPYVFNAEQRLEDYVKAELDKVCDAKRAFSIEIYDPFISSFAETDKLITGNYIKIKHTNLIGDNSTAIVQIKGITITQSKGDMFPKFAIILSEESSITRPTITRSGGIIGDLYRRYIDLGNRFGNITRNVNTINTNLGRTINVDTFNENYIQVNGVNKENNNLALVAKGTAESKNKCWAVKPIPPYYVGDQWLDSLGEEFNIGEVVYCITTRLEGDFDYNDWSLSRYKGTEEIEESIDSFDIGTLNQLDLIDSNGNNLFVGDKFTASLEDLDILKLVVNNTSTIQSATLTGINLSVNIGEKITTSFSCQGNDIEGYSRNFRAYFYYNEEFLFNILFSTYASLKREQSIYHIMEQNTIINKIIIQPTSNELPLNFTIRFYDFIITKGRKIGEYNFPITGLKYWLNKGINADNKLSNGYIEEVINKDNTPLTINHEWACYPIAFIRNSVTGEITYSGITQPDNNTIVATWEGLDEALVVLHKGINLNK